jgi:hypothetical protein
LQRLSSETSMHLRVNKNGTLFDDSATPSKCWFGSTHHTKQHTAAAPQTVQCLYLI